MDRKMFCFPFLFQLWRQNVTNGSTAVYVYSTVFTSKDLYVCMFVSMLWRCFFSCVFQMSFSTSDSRWHRAQIPPPLLQDGIMHPWNWCKRPLQQKWLPLCLCTRITWPAQPCLWYQVPKELNLNKWPMTWFQFLYVYLCCSCWQSFYTVDFTGKCR